MQTVDQLSLSLSLSLLCLTRDDALPVARIYPAFRSLPRKKLLTGGYQRPTGEVWTRRARNTAGGPGFAEKSEKPISRPKNRRSVLRGECKSAAIKFLIKERQLSQLTPLMKSAIRQEPSAHLFHPFRCFPCPSSPLFYLDFLSFFFSSLFPLFCFRSFSSIRVVEDFSMDVQNTCIT